MAGEKPFLHFVIDPGLLEKVHDCRFKGRFDPRAAANQMAAAPGARSEASRPEGEVKLAAKAD